MEAEVVGLEEARRLYPPMRVDDLVGAVWIPGDGKANPADVTQALARGARAGGATLREGVRVTGVRVRRGAVAGVDTSDGAIDAEVVVNCAGMWARELGRMSGVTIPLHACEHMYMVTQPMAGVGADLPVMRDADGHVYFKEEVGGLLMGGFDPWAKPWGMDGIPPDFSFATLPEDWEKFEVLMSNAIVRVPDLEGAAVRLLMNGPESFTPDNYFILGEAPELRRYYVAAGFCSGGIAAAGGAGHALAEWIVADRAPMDLWPADMRRFAPFHGDARLPARARERDRRACTTSWPSRTASSRAAGGSAARRSTTGSGRAAPPSAPRWAGSAPTGSRGTGEPAETDVLVRPAELVRSRGRGAPRHPRGGGRLRPDLVRQAPPRGARCRRRAPAPVRQRRGRAGRGASSTRAC